MTHPRRQAVLYQFLSAGEDTADTREQLRGLRADAHRVAASHHASLVATFADLESDNDETTNPGLRALVKRLGAGNTDLLVLQMISEPPRTIEIQYAIEIPGRVLTEDQLFEAVDGFSETMERQLATDRGDRS